MVSASGAGNRSTIVADVDEMREINITALAMPSLSDSAPVRMIAVVMLSKNGLDLVHHGFAVLDHPLAVADIRNLVCVVEEALFVPLLTGACLPT